MRLPAHPAPTPAAASQALALPRDAQWAVELAAVSLRAAPHTDPEDMLPRCARCGAASPLVGPRVRMVAGSTDNSVPMGRAGDRAGEQWRGARLPSAPGPCSGCPAQGDACASCGCAFEVCPLTWDILPLVRFELEPGIGVDEALVSGRRRTPWQCALARVAAPPLLQHA